MPRKLGVRGLRARIGNLQIGDERVFAEAFPEERFADWAIGEVHVYDERITPNGRRDAFEPSLHLSNLIGHLSITGRDVARAARSSSVERQMERSLSSVQTALTEYTRLLKRSQEAYALRDECSLTSWGDRKGAPPSGGFRPAALGAPGRRSRTSDGEGQGSECQAGRPHRPASHGAP